MRRERAEQMVELAQALHDDVPEDEEPRLVREVRHIRHKEWLHGIQELVLASLEDIYTEQKQ